MKMLALSRLCSCDGTGFRASASHLYLPLSLLSALPRIRLLLLMERSPFEVVCIHRSVQRGKQTAIHAIGVIVAPFSTTICMLGGCNITDWGPSITKQKHEL